MEKTGRRARHKVEAQATQARKDEKARQSPGSCGGAAAQRILRGDSGKIRRLPGTPGEEEKARRGERGGGRKRGRRGRKSAFTPACPRLLRCSGDEVPQVIARTTFPIFPVGFRSGPLPRMFRNATAVRRTLPAQETHVHAPRFPQGRKPPPPPPPHARSSAFSSSFTFPHTSPVRFRSPLPPCACPLAPARRSPRLPTKKRAEFPPRVCSCGPDAAAVHRRIRTCIQNEARRASRS